MDALTSLITLLKPQAIMAMIVQGRGRWGVRYSEFSHPSFALVLNGRCWLAPDGASAVDLEPGDFVLFPVTPAFTIASDSKIKARLMKPVPTRHQLEEVVHGDAKAKPSATLLGGYFLFDPINASMLLSSLPAMLHIRAKDPSIGSVKSIIDLIKSEAHENRPGQGLVMTSLIEIMLVESLRSAPADLQMPGLLAGLRDSQLAIALRAIHTQSAHPWTLASLARHAGMSRSSFAERFHRAIGRTPLNYLLHWRIAVARDLMTNQQMTVGETALAVGYQSASGFTTAFTRETGSSPKEFIEGNRRDPIPPKRRAPQPKRVR